LARARTILELQAVAWLLDALINENNPRPPPRCFPNGNDSARVKRQRRIPFSSVGVRFQEIKSWLTVDRLDYESTGKILFNFVQDTMNEKFVINPFLTLILG
jgi:hypothetical protein